MEAALRSRDHTLSPEPLEGAGDRACRDAQLGMDLARGGASAPTGQQPEDSASLLLHEVTIGATTGA